MSPYAGQLLVETVMPMIRAAVPRCVRPATGEDTEELIQDGLAIAARLIDAADAGGQVLRPRSVVHYTLQRLKSGRRSGYAGEADAMSASAEIRGRVCRTSLDVPVGVEDDDTFTLHDLLADAGEDPGRAASRNIDWDELDGTLSERERDLVMAESEGVSRKAVAHKHRVSAARITQVSRELASRIRHDWGDDILAEIGAVPPFMAGIYASRERSQCRAVRAA